MLEDRRKGVVYVPVSTDIFAKQGWSPPVRYRFVKPTVDSDPILEIKYLARWELEVALDRLEDEARMRRGMGSV